ncbi:hypothetical protein [Streptomyces sp. NPDC057694]|uniref:hypothetical protein n=1 Tax=Streptomyces sp. NPDC057694 TaxID=3346216 RepID=UPI00367C4BAD
MTGLGPTIGNPHVGYGIRVRLDNAKAKSLAAADFTCPCGHAEDAVGYAEAELAKGYPGTAGMLHCSAAPAPKQSRRLRPPTQPSAVSGTPPPCSSSPSPRPADTGASLRAAGWAGHRRVSRAARVGSAEQTSASHGHRGNPPNSLGSVVTGPPLGVAVIVWPFASTLLLAAQRAGLAPYRFARPRGPQNRSHTCNANRIQPA